MTKLPYEMTHSQRVAELERILAHSETQESIRAAAIGLIMAAEIRRLRTEIEMLKAVHSSEVG